jgi:sterol desaturase/sphingolipid hydroxylase (fatty acid hydroxylase superfamily)
MISLLAPLIAGILTWSFSEYILHRFLGHACKGRNRFSREHLAHHSDPTYFAPTSQKVLLALFWSVLLFGLGQFVLTGAQAGVFTGGFVAMYAFYEVLHRRIHTHAPMGPYGRMVRKHHLSHHFTDARLRHGVTSRIWDRVFRTHQDISLVRVPRKLATSWMLEASGDLRACYADSYALVGKKAESNSPQVG